MTQPDLFDIGERDVNGTRQDVSDRRRAVCTPADVGSGPDGKTCKTCLSAIRMTNGNHNKRWIKCEKVQKYWTHGKGTDILAGYAACSQYEENVLMDIVPRCVYR